MPKANVYLLFLPIMQIAWVQAPTHNHKDNACIHIHNNDLCSGDTRQSAPCTPFRHNKNLYPQSDPCSLINCFRISSFSIGRGWSIVKQQ